MGVGVDVDSDDFSVNKFEFVMKIEKCNGFENLCAFVECLACEVSVM